MKKLFLAIACMFSVMGSYAQDALTIENAIIEPGTTGQLNIILTNPGTNYIACQFDVTLPAGLDVQRTSAGKVSKAKTCALTERSANEDEEFEFIFTMAEVGTNQYRFTMYNDFNSPFMGASGGAIMVLTVTASENFAGGEGLIHTITLTDESRRAFNPTNATFTVNTTSTIIDQPINLLSCEDLECLIGTKPLLKVYLENDNEVKLCQFDLHLPDGIVVATKSNGKLDVRLTDRAENHSISSQRLSNGDYRFIIVSLDNDSFTGNEGTLMEITLDVPETMEVGEYTVKVMNVELSVPDGNDLIVVRPADTESMLTVKAYTPGDVNNDGSVSVTDVGCAINYILEQVPSVFVFEAADMNGDKSVSVTDVGMIINLILSEGAASRIDGKDLETNYRNDHNPHNTIVPSVSLALTDDGYELMLEDKGAFIGFQFDVELAEGTGWHWACPYIAMQQSDGDDHVLTYRKLGNGKWRVVCYSPTNSTFNADEAALLTLDTTGDVTISDIRLTTAGFEELRPADLVGTTTGIANMEQGMKISVEGGTLRITSDCDTTLRLYSLDGSIYRTLQVKKGVNSFDGLRAGIYMIGKQKVILR